MTSRSLEIEGLAAIYPDEFAVIEELPQDLSSKPPWSELPEGSPRFRLKVKPEDQQEICFAQVELWFVLLPAYPHEEGSLLIEVREIQGLSEADTNKLKDVLKQTSTSLLGREMVFDLVQCAREFLREHNVDHRTFSLHDQMLLEEKQQEEARQKQARLREQERQKELKARNKELKEQNKKKEEEEERNKLEEMRQQETKKEAAKQEKVRRMQFFNRKKANTTAGDLWGSDSDEEDEEPSKSDEEAGDSDQAVNTPGVPSSPHSAENKHATFASDIYSKPPESPAAPSYPAHQQGGAAHLASTPKTKEANQLRWKRLETQHRNDQGEIESVPEVIGQGRFGIVYMAMVEENVEGAAPKPGSLIAVKEFKLAGGAEKQVNTRLLPACLFGPVWQPGKHSCLCVFVCFCVYMCTFVCVFTYVCIYTYFYTHTRAHRAVVQNIWRNSAVDIRTYIHSCVRCEHLDMPEPNQHIPSR